MQRLHPEIRRRIRRADEVFRDRAWRKEAAWWHTEVKPSIAAQARTFLDEDLDACSDAALAAHVSRATDFAKQTVYWHHRFSISSVLLVGDLLVHTMQWTAMPAAEILQALRGLSPASVGAADEIAEVRRAVLADGDSMLMLLSDRPPSDVLAALRAQPAPVGPAITAYLDVVGLRILGGYDVADRHAIEHPDLLLKIIRGAVTADEAGQMAAREQAIQTIRARVPDAHRSEFDDLLKEAQAVYGLRDERIFHGDGLGNGIMRRALLTAGRRLSARDRINDPADLVDATPREVVAMLGGSGDPSAAELSERVRYRIETPISSAPSKLGFPPSPPPPADWLPPSAARMQRIVDLVLQLMFQPRQETRENKALQGFGVSPGVYEGRARVISSIYELPEVQQGEVLVASSTGPTFNVVLPLIGALVTERGGALPPEPQIGVVVQLLVEPLAAGVLFTRNPVTGADERMVEAAWGLGEAVVNGAVVPDRFRLDARGRVIETSPGEKDVKVWYDDGDGTIEIPVPADLRVVPCLRTEHLEALHALAGRCIGVWGPALDIEWAIGGDGGVYLLQCRPITTLQQCS